MNSFYWGNTLRELPPANYLTQRPMLKSYRNQSIDFLCKSIESFLYEKGIVLDDLTK